MPLSPNTDLTPSALGRIGEKSFSAACSKLGITCNASTEDDHGWDFLIEWPMQVQSNSPDMAPDRVRALIQVKTTRSELPIARLKLSAALSLAKAAMPAFLVLVRVMPRGEPIAFAVTHMWGETIRRTLSNARKSEKDAKPIWRQMITYRSDRLFDRASSAIEAIHNDITAKGQEYLAVKSEFEKNVGYDPLGSEMKVTFDLDSEEELIDWSLGLGDGLAVSKLDAWVSRFGITLPDRRLTASSGRMFIEPSNREAILQFRLPDGNSFSEPVEVITSALPGLPTEKQKFRLRCDLFDVVIGGGAPGKFFLKAEPVSGEPQPMVRVLRIAGMRAFKNGSEIGLTLRADGRSQSIGSINFDGDSFNPYWSVIATGLPFLIDISASVLNHNGVCLPDLFAHETLWALDIIAKLAGRNNICIVFDAETALDASYETVRGHFGVPVGEGWYHALFEWSVRSDTIKDGHRRHMTLGPVDMRDALVVRSGDGDANAVSDHFNAIVDELPAPERSLYLGDLRTLLDNR